MSWTNRERKFQRANVPGSEYSPVRKFQAAKVPRPIRSGERKFQGARRPGSELARDLLADSLQGANGPGSEKAVNQTKKWFAYSVGKEIFQYEICSVFWQCSMELFASCLRSKWVKSHLKINLNYIYFLKWWQHYADSNMRLTRHSSDSTAFEAPVNSSQHGVSAAGQLVIRFWAVMSWPCDELTGTPSPVKLVKSNVFKFKFKRLGATCGTSHVNNRNNITT